MTKEKILDVESDELREAIERLKNCATNNDLLRETNDLIKKVDQIYSKNNTTLDEDTETNKELNNSLNDVENSTKNLKNQAYDVLSKFLSIDMYKLENKRELKRAYGSLDVLKKDIKVLEKALNGEEIYNPPSLNNADLLRYINNVSPKRKGLYFRDSELKDINLMYRSQEIELNNRISLFEQQIEGIDNKLVDVKSSDINIARSLSKERTNLMRMLDSYQRKVEDINNDMNKYIIEHKIVENMIYEYSTILNTGRNLYNNVELSLSIVGSDLSPEGKTLEQAIGSLKNVKNISEKFKSFITKYAVEKKSRNSRLCDEVNKVVSDDNGEELSDSITRINKQLYNSSKSNMKAMRDTYFNNLGF
jgi:hypothetical protein